MEKFELKQRLIWGPFCAGSIYTSALFSLIQDYYGKEQWVEFVQNHWIDGIYSVPVALFLLAYAGKILFDALRTFRLNARQEESE